MIIVALLAYICGPRKYRSERKKKSLSNITPTGYGVLTRPGHGVNEHCVSPYTKMSVFKQNEAAREMHEIEGKVVNGHSAQNSGLTDGDLPGFGPENENHGNGAMKRRIGPQHSICGMILAAPGQTIDIGHERIFSEAESLYGAGEQYNEQLAVLPGNTSDNGNGTQWYRSCIDDDEGNGI